LRTLRDQREAAVVTRQDVEDQAGFAIRVAVQNEGRLFGDAVFGDRRARRTAGGFRGASPACGLVGVGIAGLLAGLLAARAASTIARRIARFEQRLIGEIVTRRASGGGFLRRAPLRAPARRPG